MKTPHVLAAMTLALAIGATGIARAQVIPAAPPPPNKVIKNDLWVIITTDTPGFKRPPGLFPSHLAHQMELERKGVLFAAGPVSSTAGKHEYGMIIVRAGSLAEAKRIADSDPMHKSGARTYVLHSWSLNEGQVNYSINLSDGKVAFK
jgi:uncharacterized protein YciI